MTDQDFGPGRMACRRGLSAKLVNSKQFVGMGNRKKQKKHIDAGMAANENMKGLIGPNHRGWLRRKFPFRKRSMPFSRHLKIFLTVKENFSLLN